MKNFSICISATLCLLAASSAVMASSGAMTAAAGDTATIKIKSKNLDGRKLTYNRSYNGVYLSTFTPAELDADSIVTITMPVDGVERMARFYKLKGDHLLINADIKTKDYRGTRKFINNNIPNYMWFKSVVCMDDIIASAFNIFRISYGNFRIYLKDF